MQVLASRDYLKLEVSMQVIALEVASISTQVDAPYVQVETDTNALDWKIDFRNPLSNHFLEFQLGHEFLEPQVFSSQPWKVSYLRLPPPSHERYQSSGFLIPTIESIRSQTFSSQPWKVHNIRALAFLSQLRKVSGLRPSHLNHGRYKSSGFLIPTIGGTT